MGSFQRHAWLKWARTGLFTALIRTGDTVGLMRAHTRTVLTNWQLGVEA
jgi:hypothetical protein